MKFEKVGYQIIASVSFYKDYHFQNITEDNNYFGCPVSINSKTLSEGWDVRIKLTNNLKILKNIPTDMLFVFLSPELVKDKISINSKLFLWNGQFIAEAIVKEIKGK